MSLSTMSIPIFSPRLSSNPFKNTHRTFTANLPSIIINIISLLARLAAQSSSLGHTSNLFSTFGSLVFGLGPTALPFHYTYFEYLRATNAMEHVLFAFVCWQEASSNESSGSHGSGPGSVVSHGVPTRLKYWIRGYPTMLPEPGTQSSKHNRLQSHRGTRTVRVLSVWRSFRVYSPDLAPPEAGLLDLPSG